MPKYESGHVYSVVIEGTAITAAQDLFELTAPTGRSVTIHRLEVDQDDIEVSEVLPIRCRVGTGATAGSGGSAVTPVRLRPGARAAATTVARNNTTAATAGSGTLVTVVRRSFNLVTGLVYAPAPEEKVVIRDGQTFIVNLPTAPAGSTKISAELIFEEGEA